MMIATPLRRSRAFTLVELMIVTVILAVMALMAIPTFAGLLGGAQRSTSQILLIHMNQDAFTLAAANGQTFPTYDDYVLAAGEVYHGNSFGTSAPLVVTTLGANSTTAGQVSITIDSAGTGQEVGLAMRSDQAGTSVYLQSSALPSSAPATWSCTTTSASSVSAAAGLHTC
jgi:prepilin-type N-terminal cleavage/methylation domain-containing protein